MANVLHQTVECLFKQQQLVLIAGPCVMESLDSVLRHCDRLMSMTQKYRIPLIFKASFDKANRTSVHSFRGFGLTQGMQFFVELKKRFAVPVLTDVHETWQCQHVAEVVDILQIPAYLCRQTDLILAAAATGRPINIKKGQFLAPEDMAHAILKAKEGACEHVSLTERGSCFGYRDLVVDMRALLTMGHLKVPVIFDATHSVQQPGAKGGSTGGQRLMALPLARAAVAVGVDAIFAEVHEKPDEALSDGPNSLSFELFELFLEQVVAFDRLRRQIVLQ